MAREQEDLEEFKDMTLLDFTLIGTLGMGGFGRVELVIVYTCGYHKIQTVCYCR